MRLPRLRLTVRLMMALVAISAALILAGQAWTRRCAFCREKAALFASREARYRAQLAFMPMLAKADDPATLVEIEETAQQVWGASVGSVSPARKRAEYVARMTDGCRRWVDHQVWWKRKYLRAMYLPWESTPDRPPLVPE